MIKVGDEIYVYSCFYLSHGQDDFIGGKATVTEVSEQMSGGEMTTFIRVAEAPRTQWNWEQYLSKQQDELREQFGESHAHAEPDNHPDFNKWD